MLQLEKFWLCIGNIWNAEHVEIPVEIECFELMSHSMQFISYQENIISTSFVADVEIILIRKSKLPTWWWNYISYSLNFQTKGTITQYHFPSLN